MLCCSNAMNGPTYEDVYGLGFKIVDRHLNCWTYPDRGATVARTEIDTSYSFLPLKVTNASAWGFRMKLKLEAITGVPIFLPSLDSRDMKVKMSYKSKNLKEAKLFVYALDKDMDVVKQDSILLRSCDEFREDSIIFDVSGVRSLSLRISAEGSDSTYEKGGGPFDETIPQELSLARILLSSGGRNINSFEYEDIPAPVIKRDRCLDLSPDSILTRGQFASMTRRITALGESVHGSAKINKATCDFIKSSILNDNTSMVIMEDPMLLMLFFNRYAQGYDDVSMEKLHELMEYQVTNVDVLWELADWIRSYNKETGNHVRFYGNDNYFTFTVNELRMYLDDYLELVNSEVRSSVIDSVLTVLKQPESYLVKTTAGKTLTAIQANAKEFSEVLGDDAEIITFYLKNLSDDIHQPDIFDYGYDFLRRDNKMFEYASFLIDRFCPRPQKAVISCHLGHAEYLSSNIPYHKPFGYYMKNKYGDEYVCIAQTVFQDKAMTGSPNMIDFDPPSSNSIESSLSKMGMKYLYIDTESLGEIIKKRNKGAGKDQYEDYANPHSQFDGVLHIN